MSRERMQYQPTVLFLCTGNSCRSQMAEGLLRHLAGDRFEVYSAGTDPKVDVHPLAVEVMREIGGDLSGHRPTHLKKYLGRISVRHLVIVCNGAEQRCPSIWPGMTYRHYWPFDDPATFVGTEAEALDEFRRVRDEIGERVKTWLEEAG